MTAAPNIPILPAAPPTIAGHAFTVDGQSGDFITLRIGLQGEPLALLARALVKLDGVRVTSGPPGRGPERCYLVSCLGFKMVLSSPTEGPDDVALALVSRVPRSPLAVLSELENVLERVFDRSPSQPPRALTPEKPAAEAPRSSLSRSTLRPGQPLARRTELRRKTPLARGPFKRS